MLARGWKEGGGQVGGGTSGGAAHRERMTGWESGKCSVINRAGYLAISQDTRAGNTNTFNLNKEK